MRLRIFLYAVTAVEDARRGVYRPGAGLRPVDRMEIRSWIGWKSDPQAKRPAPQTYAALFGGVSEPRGFTSFGASRLAVPGAPLPKRVGACGLRSQLGLQANHFLG